MPEKEEITTELAPCPFCGGEAEFRLVDGWWRIVCMGCNVMTGYVQRNTIPCVAERWNRRTVAAKIPH